MLPKQLQDNLCGSHSAQWQNVQSDRLRFTKEMVRFAFFLKTAQKKIFVVYNYSRQWIHTAFNHTAGTEPQCKMFITCILERISSEWSSSSWKCWAQSQFNHFCPWFGVLMTSKGLSQFFHSRPLQERQTLLKQGVKKFSSYAAPSSKWQICQFFPGCSFWKKRKHVNVIKEACKSNKVQLLIFTVRTESFKSHIKLLATPWKYFTMFWSVNCILNLFITFSWCSCS